MFPIGKSAAVDGFSKAEVSLQIDETDAVLQESLCVGAGFVGITLLVAIGGVRRDRNERLLGRGGDADGKGLRYPRIRDVVRQGWDSCKTLGSRPRPAGFYPERLRWRELRSSG